MENEIYDKLIELINSSENRDPDDVMNDANKILNGYGIESVQDDHAWVNHYYMNTILLYVNMGDTYDQTFCYNTEECEYFIGSWGNFYEEWISENYETCNYCKEEKTEIDDRLHLCKECKKELKEWAETFEFPDFKTFERYQQYSSYSNDVLPRLREFAGFTDPMNVGTYTEGSEENIYNLEEIFEYWEEHIKIGEDIE